ncbi:MAG: DUF6115 domain-containing protein [Bacillota bacterium]|nr:DUF6115 domain-containing protein [Bacillota bacterium]
MGIMEIILIVLGLIVFVGSFLLPAGKKSDSQDSEKISEDTIREMVEKEVEDAKSQISDIVDETITYAMEKTERSMDRLTNEKMMAVNEYSDTVLEEINKNHKEVVFLYDMLNDKHENLKSTVSEATKTVSEVKQTVKDAEILAKEVAIEGTDFTPIEPVRVETKALQPETQPKEQESTAGGNERKTHTARGAKKDTAFAAQEEKTEREEKSVGDTAEIPEVEVTLNPAGRAGGRNSNERILELHKAGKSNMAIARELGLGIGEVKLVIDLFEGL